MVHVRSGRSIGSTVTSLWTIFTHNRWSVQELSGVCGCIAILDRMTWTTPFTAIIGIIPNLSPPSTTFLGSHIYELLLPSISLVAHPRETQPSVSSIQSCTRRSHSIARKRSPSPSCRRRPSQLIERAILLPKCPAHSPCHHDPVCRKTSIYSAAQIQDHWKCVSYTARNVPSHSIQYSSWHGCIPVGQERSNLRNRTYVYKSCTFHGNPFQCRPPDHLVWENIEHSRHTSSSWPEIVPGRALGGSSDSLPYEPFYSNRPSIRMFWNHERRNLQGSSLLFQIERTYSSLSAHYPSFGIPKQYGPASWPYLCHWLSSRPWTHIGER